MGTNAPTTAMPRSRMPRLASIAKARARRAICYLGHALLENRNGLAVGSIVTQATGTAEREAALKPSEGLKPEATLGADKGYDAEGFVEALKARKIVPHIAIQGHVGKRGKVRKTAVPNAVATSQGYTISQRKRKRIEDIFGWIKTTAGLHQLKIRGIKRVKATFGSPTTLSACQNC